MAFQAAALVVLVASPSDTSSERSAVAEAIGKWNVSRGDREGVVLIPWLYEQHAVPRMGAGPQSVINQQALDRADIVVAFFDSRLGTETPEAVSGTAEEILKASDAGKPVHVYFSTEDVPRDRLDPGQLTALADFREELSSSGLLGEYASPADLGQRVQQAIDFDVSSETWGATKPPRTAERNVRWVLQHHSGDSYLARNEGPGRASKVEIAAYGDLQMLDRNSVPEDVPAGEAVSFMAMRYAGTTDDRIQVSWFEEGDEEQKTWKYPLPARPPRR